MSKPMRTTRNSSVLALFVGSLLLGGQLYAGDVVKDNNTQSLITPTSWVGGTAPTASDYAVFDGTYTSASALGTGAVCDWYGAKVTAGSSWINVNNDAPRYVVLGGGGLTMSSPSARTFRIKSLQLAADQTWDIGANQEFVIGDGALDQQGRNVSVTGDGLLRIQGSSLGLSGTSDIGTLELDGGSVTNSGTLAIDTLYFTGGDFISAGTTTVANPITMGSTNSGLAVNGGGTLSGTDLTANWRPQFFTIDGTLDLTGATTFSINNTVNIDGAGTINTGQFRVKNYTTINFSDATLNDSGYFMLGDAYGQYGNFTQNSGTVNLTTSTDNEIRIGHWAGETSTYTLNGGALSVPNSNLTLGWDGNGVMTINDGVANLRGLRLTPWSHGGNGTLNLAGGRMNIGASGIFDGGGTGTASITLGPGTVGAYASDWSSSMNMMLSDTATFDTLDANDGTTARTITLSGVLSGAGGIAKAGDGTIEMSGAGHGFSGGIAINGGTLTATGGGWTDSFFANVSGRSITINDGGTLETDTHGLGGLGAAFHQPAITVNEGGTWTVDGAQYLSANNLDLSGGTVNVTNTNLRLQSGTVEVTGAAQSTLSGLDVTMYGNVTFDVSDGASAQDLLISAPISESGGSQSLTKTGAGALTLTANSSFSGPVTVNDGRMAVSATLRDTSGMTVNNGATLELGATNMLVGNHSTQVADSRVLTADGGGSTLLMNGSMVSRIGNVTLNDGGTWTSNRGVNGGYDILLADTTAGPATVTVSGTGLATMNGSGGIHLQGVQNFDVADTVSGAGVDLHVSMILDNPDSSGGAAGGINKTGAGTMEMSGAGHGMSGGIAISDGTLKATGGGWTDSFFANVSGRSITINDGGTLETDTHGLGGLGAAFHQPGITVNEGGTWTVNGAQYLSANNLDLIGGTVNVTNTNLRLQGGTVDVTGDGQSAISGLDVRMYGNVTFDVGDGAAAQDLLISAPISESGGSQSLTKTGAGTLTLTGDSSYTGTTTVNEGELVVNGSTASNSLLTVSPGASVGGSGSLGDLSLAGLISPGNSVGTIFSGDTDWLDGASYLFEIDDATGTAGATDGPGWDLLDIAGTLDLTGVDDGGYTIDINTLLAGGGSTPGEMSSFDTSLSYDWEFAKASSGINGFEADDFVFDLADFDNLFEGTFSIGLQDTSLYISFDSTIVDPDASTVVASPAAVPADGVSTATITVTIKNAAGGGIEGKEVTLANTAGPGMAVITPAAPRTTDANGEATFTVTCNYVGTEEFTATDISEGAGIEITQKASVNFTIVPQTSLVGGGGGQPPPPDAPQTSLAGGTFNAPADSSAPAEAVTVTVEDITDYTPTENVIRVTEYYLTTGDFSGTTASLVLEQELTADYFILVRGSRADDGRSMPDNDFVRVVSVPGGRGGLADSGTADAIGLQRGAAETDWEGVVTVVECLAPAHPAGFKLVDAVVSTLSGTSGSQACAPWGDVAQVVPFGGYRGGGVELVGTPGSRYEGTSAYARLNVSGDGTLNWERDGGGENLLDASMTTFVVEWGSEWTVQHAVVAGSNGDNGADEAGEYTTAAINPVARANTLVWGTGMRADAGIGDCAESCLVTLGDGVNANATESAVAVGSEYTDAYSFDVYALTHPGLAVDHRFKPDGDRDALDLPVGVNAAPAGARLALIYNGCSGTSSRFPRPRFWSRYTADDTVTVSRGYDGADFPAWIQGIDFSGLNPE